MNSHFYDGVFCKRKKGTTSSFETECGNTDVSGGGIFSYYRDNSNIN